MDGAAVVIGRAAQVVEVDELQIANAETYDVIVAPQADQAYALVDAVMERDDLALTASAHEDAASGEWVFEATCEMLPDLLAFEDLARTTLGGAVDFTINPIDAETNWVAKSLEGLSPVVAGGFILQARQFLMELRQLEQAEEHAVGAVSSHE